MKVAYRGHEIDCHRAKSMGGGRNLYFSVVRISDRMEIISGFTEGKDTVHEYIGYMKDRIDGYFLDPSEEFPDATEEEIAMHKSELRWWWRPTWGRRRKV